MTGIRQIVKDLYCDALEICIRKQPYWVIAWAVHPDDRNLFKGSPIQQYIKGARAAFIGHDGQTDIHFEKCVDNLMNTLPRELIEKFLCGTETHADCNLFCQHAVFGEVKFPLEDIKAPHGEMAD